MNKVIIAGRLTKDPELKSTGSGTEVCNLTVAVDRKVKTKDGNKECDFIEVTAWQKTGVFANTYFHKGDGIVVDGRLESEKYTDKEGKNRVAWKVVADNIEFPVGGKKDGNTAVSTTPATPNFTELGKDEELPF